MRALVVLRLFLATAGSRGRRCNRVGRRGSRRSVDRLGENLDRLLLQLAHHTAHLARVSDRALRKFLEGRAEL